MPVYQDEVPLLEVEAEDRPEVQTIDWDSLQPDANERLPDDSDDEFASDDGSDHDDDDPEEARRKHEPDEEGKYHDDPLWWGKTSAEIRHCTNDAKDAGNKSHREGDQQQANRHWKNAMKGAQKLKDSETEFRLRLNLAMGYTKLGKTSKALDHCSEALRDSLRSAVPPALQAKAHFRRAEALEAAGEVEKALASLKAALELEPDNADMRRKHAELKRLALEHRKREKALFAGKSLLQAMSDGKPDPREASSDTVAVASSQENSEEEYEDALEGEDEGENGEQADDFDYSTLTDRAQADELCRKISDNSGVNYVGDPMSFLGPIKVHEKNTEE